MASKLENEVKIENLYIKLMERRLLHVTDVNNQIMMKNKVFKRDLENLKAQSEFASKKIQDLDSFLGSDNLIDPIPSLRLMTFIKEQLNDYLYTDKPLLIENPVFRLPELKEFFKGSKFEIVKRKREAMMEDISSDNRLTSGNYVAPVFIVKLVHDTKIKQMFFGDSYGGKIVNSIKDVSETKDKVYFDSDGQASYYVNGKVLFENYIPRVLNIKHINKIDTTMTGHCQVFLERDLTSRNLLEYEDIKNEFHKKNQIKEILSEENLLDTTIYIELYKELLLNIDKRFKEYPKTSEDETLFKNEIKVLFSLFKRNSLLLDAFNNLISSNYDFVPEMYSLVGKVLSETNYPFFNNFLQKNKKEKVIAINNLSRNIKKMYDNINSQEDYNEYQNLIYNYKRGQEKDPYEITFLKENEDALNFVMFIGAEVDKLSKFGEKWKVIDESKTSDENHIVNFFMKQYDESFVVKLQDVNSFEKNDKEVGTILTSVDVNDVEDDDFKIKEKTEITIDISKYFEKQNFVKNEKIIEMIAGAQNDLLSMCFEKNGKNVSIATRKLIYKSFATSDQHGLKNENLESGEIKIVFDEKELSKEVIKHIVKKMVLATFEFMKNNLMNEEIVKDYSRLELQLFNNNELLIHSCLNELIESFNDTNASALELYELSEKEVREKGLLKSLNSKEEQPSISVRRKI